MNASGFQLLRICFWAAGVVASTWAAVPKLQPSTNSSAQRREIIQQVRALLLREDFAALDALGEQLWREKARLPEGVWKLPLFYTGLNVDTEQRAKVDWPAVFARFERWERARPDSLSARVGHAQALTSYAWEARGSGYADTVTEEGWRLFGERLRHARDVLDAKPALTTRPGYYQAMMTVALGQGWSRRDYDRLFAAAVKLAPDYETFYFRKANFLQAKWYGNAEDEWHEFALASSKALEPEHGQAFYTRIVWSVIGTGSNRSAAWKAQRVDWPRMREGFQDLARQFPGSLWNQNAFAFYACEARDQATARKVFTELNGRYTPATWGSAENFRRAQAWALGDGGSAR